MIPKRFIRLWLGPKAVPERFEKWWLGFQKIHPDYDFVTITDSKRMLRRRSSNKRRRYLSAESFWKSDNTPYHNLQSIYQNAATYAGRSDVLRLVALYELGGIYIDTDMMPLKSFDGLLKESTPFAGKRSSKSFESAVLGGAAKDPALLALLEAMPSWSESHKDSTLPLAGAFISSVWWGHCRVRHLPIETFYPYNGFGLTRERKHQVFDEHDFPPEMLAAHFSENRWGGKPKD